MNSLECTTEFQHRTRLRPKIVEEVFVKWNAFRLKPQHTNRLSKSVWFKYLKSHHFWSDKKEPKWTQIAKELHKARIRKAM